MLHYLETRSEIAQAQKKLEATLRRAFSQTAIKDIGYPGGRERNARVASDGRHWFWTGNSGETNTPRRLNWFGILGRRPGVPITVEVNVPYKGRNNQASGFFARDSTSGITYLLHSGRVGGGAAGVGKDKFLTWAKLRTQPLLDVMDSAGGERRGLLVMPIEGTAAPRAVARYIDLVSRFKVAARNGDLDTIKFKREERKLKDYFAEGRGRRMGRRRSTIDYISRHGDVVDALHLWRRSKPMRRRARIVKDVYIDMGMAVDNKLIEVFEVKPGSDRTAVYTALGQLSVHGRHKGCRRVIVLPHGEQLARDLSEALASLQIETVHFKFDGEEAKIVE